MIFAFFSIYGLYYAIRYKWKELAPLWAVIIGYQFILFKAMLFTSVRFLILPTTAYNSCSLWHNSNEE
ncbi:MAG: hypothetical protein IPJ16_05840 [Bacteroidales bacterium]|nr:hypothetical protein [Bacteroidales bacterium]